MVSHKVVGGRDVQTPLSAKGEEQARRLGLRLRRDGVRLDKVVSSHAVRARRTAEIACNLQGFPAKQIAIEPQVVEFSQGELEKQPRAEVYRAGGQMMGAIKRDGMFFRPPGVSPDGDRGESQHDVEVRMKQFVDELLLEQQDASDEQQRTVVVFSHGIAIRSFLREVMGARAGYVLHSETENTSITELVYKPTADDFGGWTVVRIYDAAHLAVSTESAEQPDEEVGESTPVEGLQLVGTSEEATVAADEQTIQRLEDRFREDLARRRAAYPGAVPGATPWLHETLDKVLEL